MRKDEWLTPPDLLKKLGEFDLDPCAPINRIWETANKHYTRLDNGLMQNWEGRVWLNPPYGKDTVRWIKKLADHNNGIALTFARTETKIFFDAIWYEATAILFIKGRLYFYHANGKKAKANSGAPSVLVAYNETNAEILKNSGIEGKFIKLK